MILVLYEQQKKMGEDCCSVVLWKDVGYGEEDLIVIRFY